MKNKKNQKKIKVLLCHNFYQIPGGEDTVMKNEKEMLENQGHEVFLYTRDNNEIKEYSLMQKIMLPFVAIFSLKTYKEIKKICRERKIDIVHIHNTLTLISPSVYYAAIKCNTPVIQTVHNFRMICPNATLYSQGEICEKCITNNLTCSIWRRCYKNSYIHTMMATIILKVHRMTGIYKKINFICLSEFNRNKLLLLNKGKSKYINEESVYVKPNFIDRKNEVLEFTKRKNQYVYVGRVDEIKGIKVLLNAWKEIAEFELHIYGQGPEYAWCEAYIQENNLDNVKLLGFINNTKVLDVIGEAKGLILPTQWYEGFPMTIVEAFSTGTPVIGSNIGNVGEIIKDNITGKIFDYRSSKDLIRAIRECSDYVDNCYAEYIRNYTSEINYKELMHIYNNCLELGKMSNV